MKQTITSLKPGARVEVSNQTGFLCTKAVGIFVGYDDQEQVPRVKLDDDYKPIVLRDNGMVILNNPVMLAPPINLKMVAIDREVAPIQVESAYEVGDPVHIKLGTTILDGVVDEVDGGARYRVRLLQNTPYTIHPGVEVTVVTAREHQLALMNTSSNRPKLETKSGEEGKAI